MARTASVARRIRSSLRVFHAKIASATNAPIATAKRLKKIHRKNTRDFSRGLRLRLHPQPASPGGIVLASIILVVIILVHREGFEPSYLRGGADLQSAGFNHSPTCAELQNSPAICCRHRCRHPVFIADIHVSLRRSFRRICDSTDACKREEQKCARVCDRTQTPHLENSLMECRWKIC